MLNKSLSWSSHISTISSKEIRTFNFLKHNLSNCSRKVKESEYLTIVAKTPDGIRISCVGFKPKFPDPTIKKGQRHAARWIFNHFSRFSSVSAMLNEINYPGYLFGPVAKYQDFKFYIRY